MDKCREAFEKAFPVPAHWIEFNKKMNKYHCPHCADYGASIYQAKWEAWQEQQKRIDELQAWVDAATNVYEKYRNGCCDIYDVFDEVEQALKGGEV